MIDPVRRIPDIINEVVSGQKYNAETFRLISITMPVIKCMINDR